MSRSLDKNEIFAWGFCLSLSVALLSPFLLGVTSMCRDSLLAEYPFFQYFAQSLGNGVFPWWNPFSHTGEPFYPVLGHKRLLDPTTLLFVAIGTKLTRNIPSLFNSTFYLHSLVTCFGVYLNLRLVTSSSVIRLLLIPILLTSPLFFVPFWQAGTLYVFLWVPYILLLMNKIALEGKTHWKNWILLGGLIGLNAQSYWISGTFFLIFFYVIGLILFHRNNFFSLIHKEMWSRVLLCFSIILLMMLPNLVIFQEREEYAYPFHEVYEAQKAERGGPGMSYEAASKSGNQLRLWNFFQTLDFRENGRHGASECVLSLGALVSLLALFGFVCGRHQQANLWRFILVGVSLLALGRQGGLHALLHPLLPPLWYFRNIAQLSSLILFGILFFFVLGANTLLKSEEVLKNKNVLLFLVILFLYHGVFFLWAPAPLTSLSYLLPFAWVPFGILSFSLYKKKNWESEILIIGVLAGTVPLYLHFSAFLSDHWFKRHVGLKKELASFSIPKERTLFPENTGPTDGNERDFYYRPLLTQDLSLFNKGDNPDYQLEDKGVLETYFIKKRFYGLLTSPLSDSVKAELFGVGSNLAVFRSCVNTIADNEFLNQFTLATPETATQLLWTCVQFEDGPSKAFQRGTASAIYLIDFEPNRQTYSVEVGGEGYLVRKGGWDKNWTAKVEGHPTPVLRANVYSLAVKLNPGRHLVEFSFVPKAFLYALVIFYVTFFVCLAGYLMPIKNSNVS